jgi:hypothetical protein
MEGPPSGDLGRPVFLISRHVLDARGIEETPCHELDRCFAIRRSNEESSTNAPCVGKLLDVAGRRGARLFVRTQLPRGRLRDRAQYVFTGQVVKADTHRQQQTETSHFIAVGTDFISNCRR